MDTALAQVQVSDTSHHHRSPVTKGGRQTITPPTPEVTRPVPEQPSGLRMDEQGASRLIVRQHGEREEKNEFEELVSVATSLQDSKPAQVLTLEWRKPHAYGHRVAGSDTAGVLRFGNDFLMSSNGISTLIVFSVICRAGKHALTLQY